MKTFEKIIAGLLSSLVLCLMVTMAFIIAQSLMANLMSSTAEAGARRTFEETPDVVTTTLAELEPLSFPSLKRATPTTVASMLTATPALSTTAQIFDQIAPSLAFIETPIGTGSGVLIEDGYLITNAHVVWPFEEVRVVFPDGSEYLEVPVLNSDLLGDLAIIGPIETTSRPLDLMDGEDLAVGSEVFLIGYPGEVDLFPQPSITRGLISRVREWTAIHMTFFQTDALIAGGQSGGVLVNKKGEVIGISGMSFSEAGFGLVASANDILPRAQKLIAGKKVDGLGERGFILKGEQLDPSFTLQDFWDSRIYLISEPIGTEIDLEVTGDNEAGYVLVDAYGFVLAGTEENINGVITGSVTTDSAAPHFIQVWHYSDNPEDYQVQSNHGLIPYHDVDDGAGIERGQTVAGRVDYPQDFDYFVINLGAGETIEIIVDSLLIDPLVIVDYPGAVVDEFPYDDNSGGGLFGLNSKLTFKAPHRGDYFIVVQDSFGVEIGGYLLTVSPAP